MKPNLVSTFGLKIMQKMEPGGPAKLLTNGGLRVGSLNAPASLVKDLASRDLISFRENDIATLTEAGAMYLRRMKTVRKLARAKKPAGHQNIYRAQHANLKTEEVRDGKRREKITRNIGGTPLGWLLTRKDKAGKTYITLDQFNAGERLANDYEFAGMMPRTVSHYDGVPVSGKGQYSSRVSDPSLTQISAKRRVNEALEFVGPGLADILIRVCCYHDGLEQAEKHLSWPTRSGKLVLKIALERLTEHYKPGRK